MLPDMLKSLLQTPEINYTDMTLLVTSWPELAWDEM